MSLKRSKGSTPGFGSARAAAVRAIRTTAKELSASSEWTIDWDSTEYDYGDFWTSGDPTVFTVPADGIYHMQMAIGFEESFASDQMLFKFFRDTTNIFWQELDVYGGPWPAFNASAINEFSAGDEITARFTHNNTTGTVWVGTAFTWMTVTRVA